MIRAAIADDEILARHKLRLLLEAESDVSIIGESATAAETMELVRLARPDILFLDIRMPGADAFEILRGLGEHGSIPPSIIFTTAYDHYASRAFEVDAVDYLLKPFTAERLRTAVGRARRQIDDIRRPVAVSAGKQQSGSFLKRIVFKSRGRIVFLPVSEIRWVGAEENYVRLCAGAETHLVRETLTHLTEKLDPELFLRVHRSFVVNLQYVKEFAKTDVDEPVIVLRDGQQIAVSRGYRSRVRELMLH
ncbi:MAG TPA: LytTR family DNA-binding domain-containing protein [Acidobacteriaceae bacterium]|nr:LytTR family DNA-binding domain-containing protein [Acidobacteriaceae bacterium]